jgi:hypothetical protein
MKKVNLTHQIRELQLNAIMEKLEVEVLEELATGDLGQLKAELSSLFNGTNNRIHENVVSLAARKRPQVSFESVQLLAAAGLESHDWYSTPIRFFEYGFNLEIRKILGYENEVEITLVEDDASEGTMAASLSAFKDKSVNIVIQSNQIDLLEGEIYIDSEGKAASGQGRLVNHDKELVVKNSLTLSIL